MPLSFESEQSRGGTTGPQYTLRGQSMDPTVHPRRSCLRKRASNDGTTVWSERPIGAQGKTVKFVASSENLFYDHKTNELEAEAEADDFPEEEMASWGSDDDEVYMSPVSCRFYSRPSIQC